MNFIRMNLRIKKGLGACLYDVFTPIMIDIIWGCDKKEDQPFVSKILKVRNLNQN